MTRVTLNPLILCVSVFAITACTNTNEAEYLAPNGAPQSTELVARDVEAPEVFQITEPGQWDGNPSLGGVWATHPSAKGTQRVIIRNPANNRFVVGSLFVPNASSAGTDLQVSSDAAAALGMIAVDPTPLNVTALRQVPVNDPAPVETALAPMGVDTTALAPAPVPAPVAPMASDAASELTRPFIQVGTFAVRSNAQSVVDQLESAGVSARIRDDTARGTPVFGVLAGPANSSAQRDDILTKVKAQGFSDAYPVKG